jgi:hypothetical protein
MMALHWSKGVATRRSPPSRMLHTEVLKQARLPDRTYVIDMTFQPGRCAPPSIDLDLD